MLTRTLTCLALMACTIVAAPAATLTKSYSYFFIGGRTLDEIEAELLKRGPQVKRSGDRHPGATRMEFTTRIGYGEKNGRCRIVKANVIVKAKVILPKWRQANGVDPDVRLIWSTLESDIKRHEESHVVIAKNHARDMEQALLKMSPHKTCKQAAHEAKAITSKFLAKHDAAQSEFDRVEGINFERRLLRLLQNRLERMEASGKS
ncbi:DUF922 domain-containing protein [Pseudaminobacter sp. 19-2017]|uniref:DUF922 domain-containing protein n=1 Tax=Pseudaminobacter soli (ex Zhang et al. 2022) TaxID=2831468 RepID=A0A942DUS3_9HYPH|nr:DUF922 domain-containing protein [Pseudaminobacter soli]MBS3647439.1 DUF922 domain-containing protein [Pseudaminobacter soli]